MLKSILLLSLLPSLSFAGELDKLQPNAWTDVKPKYEGAPNGGQIFPMGWNNKGTYDPQSKRVLLASDF
jgi:hypothetical protein